MNKQKGTRPINVHLVLKKPLGEGCEEIAKLFTTAAKAHLFILQAQTAGDNFAYRYEKMRAE